MSNSVVIKSANSEAMIEFANYANDYFEVVLSEPNFRGMLKVYQPDSPLPTELFRDLARDWKGWDGKRSWASIEGELTLSATCDSAGHTMLTVELRRQTRDAWRLLGHLLLEAGQLDQIARDLDKFFTPKR